MFLHIPYCIFLGWAIAVGKTRNLKAGFLGSVFYLE
jgi:hypothetical protein